MFAPSGRAWFLRDGGAGSGPGLGIDVTAALVPAHILVKYRDESGNIYNLEATDKAQFAPDAMYQRRNPMSAAALANGVYMRWLSKRETAVLMMETLTQVYIEQGKHEQLIALTGLALEYDPKSVNDMIRKSNAHHDLVKQHFASKYNMPQDIPQRDLPYYKELRRNQLEWGEKATVLGWRPPDPTFDEDYLKYIKKIKSTK